MAVFFLFPANFFIAFRLRDIRALIGRRAISYSARRWIYACRHLYRKGRTVSFLVNQIWYFFSTRKKLIVYTKSAVNPSPRIYPNNLPSTPKPSPILKHHFSPEYSQNQTDDIPSVSKQSSPAKTPQQPQRPSTPPTRQGPPAAQKRLLSVSSSAQNEPVLG